MKDTENTPVSEQQLLQQTQQLRVFCGDDDKEDSAEVILDFEQHTEQKETEEYWAGRNLAQRRSARVAA
ncbi:MAG: hypothetical protein HQ567_29160 [Candidatus Nealsonbacteria bacterium]|nr:hypothetical protein [Candidatus Nealsonbacteria bacterium]